MDKWDALYHDLLVKRSDLMAQDPHVGSENWARLLQIEEVLALMQKLDLTKG